jgi:hypothetical protein
MHHEPQQDDVESIDYSDAPEMKSPVLLWSGPYAAFLKQQRKLMEEAKPPTGYPSPQKIRSAGSWETRCSKARRFLNSR